MLKMQYSKNNIEIIESLIAELNKQLDAVENNINIINQQILKLKKQREDILNILDDYQPINPKKIAKHIYHVNDEFDNLIDIENLNLLKKQINNSKDALNELNNYYINEYLKTVEGDY